VIRANHFEKWLTMWQFGMEKGQGPAVNFTLQDYAVSFLFDGLAQISFPFL